MLSVVLILILMVVFDPDRSSFVLTTATKLSNVHFPICTGELSLCSGVTGASQTGAHFRFGLRLEALSSGVLRKEEGTAEVRSQSNLYYHLLSLT